MASLKEIKIRIHSVKSTQKITSAMKMVSSSKLRKSQKVIESFLPYQEKLNTILQNFLSGDVDTTSPLSEVRSVKRIAIIALSSNSSLCGSFNANVIRKLGHSIEKYAALGAENIEVYPIGKKITQAAKKLPVSVRETSDTLAEKPNYDDIVAIAEELCIKFLKGEIDRVELIYHHFKSRSSQILTQSTFLPIELHQATEDGVKTKDLNYIAEPDRQTIVEELIPKVIRLKLYAALLDSNASEHAARTIAMQTATDNADDLLQELSLQYNKLRQQAITNELLDIVGGSFGVQ